MGSEGWIFDSHTAVMDVHHILDGAVGLSIPKADAAGMKEFILDVKQLNSSSQELFKEFWETLFHCKFKDLASASENVLDMKIWLVSKTASASHAHLL